MNPIARIREEKKKPLIFKGLESFGSPNGTRTRVSGVRGRYPRPLDDGTAKIYSLIVGEVAGGGGFEPP